MLKYKSKYKTFAVLPTYGKQGLTFRAKALRQRETEKRDFRLTFYIKIPNSKDSPNPNPKHNPNTNSYDNALF